MKLSKVKLSDLGEVVTGKTPPTKNEEYYGKEFPFITPTDINGFERYIKTERHLSDEGYEYQKRILLPSESVCFVCIGATIGKICITKTASFTNQQINSIKPNTENHDPKFIYYLLSTKRKEVKKIAGGAATPIVNKSSFSDFEVEVPRIEKQIEIASILSTFDDVIENNSRRIEILEEMARRIYREWFVHFRYPGYEDDELVDSGTELGEIPEEWEVRNVIDLYDTSAGGTPSRKKDEYFDGSIPWVKTKELNDTFIQETEETITKTGLDNSSAKLFPKTSVLIAMYGATIGQLVLLDLDATTNQACCAVKKKEEPFDYSYIFFTLLEHREKLIGLSQGAAQQNINQGIVKEFKLVAPEANLLVEFQKKIYPILDQIRVLKKQSERLKETRDLLLPT